MNRFLMYFVLCGLFPFNLFSQNRPINNESYKNWQRLLEDRYAISNDGKHLWYAYTSDYLSKNCTLVLATLDGNSKLEFASAQMASFTEDSRNLVVYLNNGIKIVNLKTGRISEISEAKNCKIPAGGNGKWLGYVKGGNLILLDLYTRQELKYDSVLQYWFNAQGTQLVIASNRTIKLVALSNLEEKEIWKSKADSNVYNVLFDKSGKHFVFSVKNANLTTFYSCNTGTKRKQTLLSDNDIQFNENCLLSNDGWQFSSNSEYLFFKIKQAQPLIKKDSNVITDQVDIWHYKDPIIQSAQLLSPFESFKRQFTAAINLQSKSIVKIESSDTAMVRLPGSKYVLIKTVTNQRESFWNKANFPCFQLLSLSDGARTSFIPNSHQVLGAILSPSEKFVVWIDKISNQIFCFNILTKKIVNVTATINSYSNYQNSTSPVDKYSIVEWISEDKGLILYSEYDIWQFDPIANRCTNITGNYGRLHKTPLKIAIEPTDIPKLKQGDSLLLVGINDTTRENGFFKVKLSVQGVPWKGVQCACAYYYPYMMGEDRPPTPKKAKYSRTYVLLRQSSIEAVNVVVTADFNTFSKISDLHPQTAWKWMTSEPVNWTLMDSTLGKGILFKPEDFDSSKRYPIIFTYYEIRSKDCYQYRPPSLSIGHLDIAWYVSNDYVVFMPDVTRISGKTGWSSLTSVLSAANYLTSKYKWIDSTKMGLQGHSFGGYETNYISTHSNIFAAAQSSAGISNCFTGYGSLGFGERSVADVYENGQLNLGCAPWENPDIYIENSPILTVNKVTTPLLLMHNKKDWVVSFNQSLELFLALRRLQKPVWLLQYDNQSHTLDGASEYALDFTIRQQQFFDHFLKDKPAPKWLINPIPAYLKGVKSGL